MRTILVLTIALLLCDVAYGLCRHRRIRRPTPVVEKPIAPMTPQQWQEKMRRIIEKSDLPEDVYYMRAV